MEKGAYPPLRDREYLLVIESKLSDLIDALEAYRSEMETLRQLAGGGGHLGVDEGGVEDGADPRDGLAVIQLKRIQRLLEYLAGEGDELVRDMLDRSRSLEEARARRFV